MKIAFLGTGIMGAPMARHLAQAGHDVSVWNRSPEKARPLAEHGADVAGGPASAVDGAEVVVTMLTDGGAVEDVMREAAPAAAQGTVWWQASTVGIDGTEGLAALAEEHGLTFVDAPVLGTRGPAEGGELVVLASGPPDALERLAPLFDAVGSKTLELGEAGTGSRLKLVMNLWVVSVTDAIAETIAFAQGLDLDPHLFLDTIAGGSLDLGYAHFKGPGMIAGDLPVSFPLKHALKDADLILEAADRHAVELALARTVRERFAAAAQAGYGDADMGMVIEASRPRRDTSAG
ncbi:MAG TPA: NAD(P)-dependent oxidoreductase [Baekduia sp.]|uniref:NAD(P)-dependent oxidoreductase n=1 Tax=Baekduia sp. TaxID=2600305 RepID=UPI002CB5BBD5|nr:NAD(P)-dependent oxidoreductase [Baekduia sp.]HMJ36840.1 NAD(P)-dependent oxidoreductase [Baekduia sp.]